MRALTLIPPTAVSDPHQPTIMKGILGTVAALGSTGVSFISQLEAWLRIASLVVGISVGITTLISVVVNLRRNKQNKVPIKFESESDLYEN